MEEVEGSSARRSLLLLSAPSPAPAPLPMVDMDIDTTGLMLNITLSSIDRSKGDESESERDDGSYSSSHSTLSNAPSDDTSPDGNRMDNNEIPTSFVESLKFFKLPSLLKKVERPAPLSTDSKHSQSTSSAFLDPDEAYSTKPRLPSSSLFISTEEAYSSASASIAQPPLSSGQFASQDENNSAYVESPSGGFDSTFVNDVMEPLKGKLNAIGVYTFITLI